MTKLQVGISGALAVAGATGLVLQAQSNAALREEVASLRRGSETMAAARTENRALKRAAAEVVELRGEGAQFERLSAEAAALKVRMAEVARAEAAAAATLVDRARLDRQPRPTFQARPEYPAELRKAGVTGEVMVEFVVDTTGVVRNARAVRPQEVGERTPKTGDARLVDFIVTGEGTATGSSAVTPESVQRLEAAAVEAVSKWKFEAGQKGGRAVNTVLRTSIVFGLSGGAGR